MNPLRFTSTFVFLFILMLTSVLYPQVTMFQFSNGQKYVMNQDLEGPDTGEQYFLMEYVYDALLDGSENYYSVSIEEPHSESDCFGLKISGENAARDTVMRVVFYHCKAGIYLRGWGGEGGLVNDCSFIENRVWGIRTGQAGNSDFEIKNCLFQDNKNGLAIKASENVWIHNNIFNRDTLTALFLAGHAQSGPSKHNIIENNIITNHSRYGMEIANEADSNYIQNNQFINDKITIYNNSNHNLFLGNHISDCDTALIINESIGNYFERDTIENCDFDLVLKNGSDAKFVGTIFDSSKVRFNDDVSALTVQWFLDVRVVDMNEDPIDDVVVTVFDNQDQLIVTDTTNAEGEIDAQKLTSYVMKRDLLNLNTPFKVKTDIVSYDSALIDLNQNLQITFTPSGVTNIIEKKITPNNYSLGQNFPNPFNPETKIKYELSENTDVVLTIFDINGRVVRILVKDNESAGEKIVTWDGKDTSGRLMSSGIYFYRLEAGQYTSTKRMVLLK